MNITINWDGIVIIILILYMIIINHTNKEIMKKSEDSKMAKANETKKEKYLREISGELWLMNEIRLRELNLSRDDF